MEPDDFARGVGCEVVKGGEVDGGGPRQQSGNGCAGAVMAGEIIARAIADKQIMPVQPGRAERGERAGERGFGHADFRVPAALSNRQRDGAARHGNGRGRGTAAEDEAKGQNKMAHRDSKAPRRDYGGRTGVAYPV